MFGKLIRSAMLTLALAGGATAAAGGLAGMSAAAQEVRIGVGSGPVIQVQGRGYDHRHDRWRERDRDRGGCDARQALRKADRMGVHRARVVDAGRRTVTVAGRDRGGRTFVRFANARGCPVIGQR
ncbi:hypothetical protein [Aureimonas altamirensis]|uniref:hypothetical protein n=1 Tax=Aureimonas altamirensis TaxID=370622 RepID=UPI003015D573